ncbi:MAG TPA: AAA family ATPase [Candidatus Aminicenantes bacterium]|nr:AAA family ATPase [Candidatus Aminicenantes bacterium]HRY65916.1 AAA family ATPase [Candidatus Aminicenantes bacterium]HRZ72758.1 AAA family ATPase [Candidatus Aminicenantes bacterium]
MFNNIKLNYWRQFNDINLDFDQRMTVLTGENGTGKTTILNILSRHFGWNLYLISTPSPCNSRTRQFWTDVWERLSSDNEIRPGSIEVGSITYSSGKECKLMVPPKMENAKYNIKYSNQEQIPGLHVPSHSPAFAYRRIENIPTDPKTSQQQYQQYQQGLQQLFQEEQSRNPGGMLKQSLVAMAVFGYGNEAVVGNQEYRRIFIEFQDVLRILLPKSLGFSRLEIRMPDVVLVTESGDFSLDAASGGIGALFSIAWQIFMYGIDKGSFVVTIDEPESHLHPSMQRELLPNLIKAFPQTQFIIATHSPFIVTSTPEARVYALMFNKAKRVDSRYLEAVDLSGTANETLREILGVPISVPVWVEERFNRIIMKYIDLELTKNSLEELKSELNAQALGFLLPEAILDIKKKNAKSY